MTRFEQKAIDRMVAVGHTTARSVRLWLRSPATGPHRLTLQAETDDAGDDGGRAEVTFVVPDDPRFDGTHSLQYPDDFPDSRLPRLRPRTRYRYAISSAGGEPVGDGRFETAPLDASDAPDQFAIAVMSCHQPFDDDVEIAPEAARALEVLPQALAEHHVTRVLMIGDQMYADRPKSWSLFDRDYFRHIAPPERHSILDCTRDEVRRIYQQRYRIFWSTGRFREVQANWPCYLIHDDHEIVDNFGSAPEHSQPPWRNLREGALDASYDYQGLRIWPRLPQRPRSVHGAFDYGPASAFVMDLRSCRQADEQSLQMYEAAQLRALTRHLQAHTDRAVQMVALSVPLVHVPDWAAALGARLMGEDSDAADRWSNPKATRSRTRLFRLLHDHQKAHPAQTQIMLGGDVHIGAVSRLRWSDHPHDAWQFTSSAVTNLEHPLFRLLARLAPSFTTSVEEQDRHGQLDATIQLARGIDGRDRNPYGGLNVGLVCLRRTADGWKTRLKLVGVDDSDPPRPTTVFETPEF